MKNKLTALLCAAVMCFGIFPMTAMAQTVTYDDAVGLFDTLDILSTSDVNEENADENISRVDFAIFMSRLFGEVDDNIPESNYFYDIPEDHWGKASINTLVERNIISVGNRSLRPDDTITRNEAATMAVIALGRQVEAEALGGYPSGYLAAAQNLKLFKGVSGGQEMTYANAAVFLYNTATASITYTQKMASGSSKVGESSETLLSMYYDVYFDEGIVEAVEGVSLTGVQASKGKMVIDGEVLKTDAWYYDSLGLELTYFYHEADDEKTVIYVSNNLGNNQEILNLETSLYEEYRDGYVYYRKDAEATQKSKIKIYPGAMIVKNGQIESDDLISALDKNNFYGSMRIVDTGRFDGADVIVIEDYENIVVTKTDSDKKLVYYNGIGSAIGNLDGLPIDLSEEEDESKVVKIYSSNGEATDFATIGENLLISIALSADKSFAIVKINNDEISGTVKGTYTDDDEPYIVIGGERYVANPKFFAAKKDSIALGVAMNFKLDCFGKIAGYSYADTEGMQYACLIDGKLNEEEKVVLRLYTFNGEMRKITCADKTKIDGVTYKTPKTILGALSSVGEVTVQGIGFKLNSDGEIRSIDTTTVSSSENKYSLHKLNTSDSSYYHWTGLFGMCAYVPSDVPVMIVPPKKEIKKADDSYFAVKSRGALTVSASYNIDLLVMDPDSRIPDMAICYYDTDLEARSDSALYVVEKVTSTLNSDDQEALCFTLFDTSRSNYIVSSKYSSKTIGAWKHVDPSTISSGDVIRLGFDSVGEIVDIVLIFDYSVAEQNTSTTFFNNAINPSYILSESAMLTASTGTVTGYGYVSKKNGTTYEWGFNSPFESNQLYGTDIQSSSLKYFVFDSEKTKEQCSAGSAADLVSYEESKNNFSKIVTLQRDKILSKMIIYK